MKYIIYYMIGTYYCTSIDGFGRTGHDPKNRQNV